MEPRTVLRIEGLAVLALALAGYFTLAGPGWLLLAFALAPDLSMLGYLAGPKLGSLSYNVAHTYTLPLALGAVGVWATGRLALLVALIWGGHIGTDRAFGYGLKFESGFKHTHLSTQLGPIPRLVGRLAPAQPAGEHTLGRKRLVRSHSSITPSHPTMYRQ